MKRNWAVVQMLAPFGARIASRHWTKWGAVLRCSWRNSVMTVTQAEELDAAIAAEFNRTHHDDA